VPNRAYDNVRTLIEELGGTMVYQRRGYRWGAWIITIGDKQITLPASGDRSFPEIDSLHVSQCANPKHWDDYSKELLPDAKRRLLRLLK
jgi:hypothetical protein